MCMCDKCKTSSGRGCGTVNARKSRSVPFVPSATAAGSEKFTNSLRKAKNTKGANNTRISLQPSKNRPKMSGKTEYDEKFVEWELPEQVYQAKKHAPTGFYETDMETFNWESEQKRSFVKKNAYQIEDDSRVAGVARLPVEAIPASFAWPGGDRAEPPEEPRTKKHAMKGQMSEHKNKYRWPEMEERVKSARPPPTIQASPIALDTSALIDSAQQWHSEYDAQCAELRRKQQDLLKSTQTTAGITSASHGRIPAFYAWEEPEAPRDNRPQPAATSTRGATSEYKTRFVEWGAQERQQPVVPVEAAHLNLFKEDPSKRGLSGPERTSSVLRHDYPGHDVTALGPRQSAHPDRGDANPKAFAWPLVDGNLPEEDDEQITRMRKHRQKNLVNGANCSEYTRTFANPPADAYTNTAQAHKPTVGKALDLFADKSRGQVSEYKAQYHAFPGSGTPERQRATPHNGGEYPTQFAWSLVNGGDASLDSPVREKRAPKVGDDVSEYNRKFNWPAGERSPVRRGPPSDDTTDRSHHRAGIDSIIGLDAADLEASKWQSEYDLQCTRLRQKQLELQGNQHIAGVATKDNGKIPRNYAWEMPPVPVPDPSLVVHHFDAAQHSEYGESFKQWPQQPKRESYKPTVVTESLNLFAEKKHDESFNADDVDALNARLQSEYNDKFHAFESNDARQKSATGLRGVPLPPQFAWPRVDPPAPPSDKPKGDSHVAFTEVSEYGSSFAWPSAIEPAKIVRPTTPSGTVVTSASLIFPVGDSSTPEVESQWVSEYDAHTKDVLGVTDKPTAGMPTFPHANIPNFYAWIDKNGQAKKEPQPERTRYSANQVRSEHDAAFAAPASAPVKVSPVVPKVVTESLNLMALPPGSKYVPGVTEYDSKYIGHSADAVKQLENPYLNKKSSAIEVPKPAQFAWPLVDGEPKTENEPPRETASTAHSEYSTQFTWHGLADTVNGRRANRMNASVADEATALADTARAVIENGPIAVDERLLRASDWQSEYDDRSSALQRKQKELALKETLHIPEPRTAGLVTAPHDNCPAFYAWEPKQPQEVATPRNTGDTGTTEYRSSFQSWPVKAGKPSAALDKTAHTKPIEAFRIGRGTHFEGLTEYDDKFGDKTTRAAAPPVPNSLTAKMNARYSAANPIVPPAAPTQRVPSSFVGNTSKISKHTENRDNYAWPQSGRLSSRKATPVLNSQRSKVVIGVNHPAVRDQLKSSNKTTSRVDYTAHDAFPDSGFQSQDTSESGSCVDKENCNRVCNVCAEPITDYQKSRSESQRAQYKLMAEELKARRASPPRSSFTTGVLSSPASTVNSGRREAFNSTMSVDSLGAPATERFTSSFHASSQRFPSSESHQVYRAHSVPHRQRLAVTYNQEPAAHCPIKSRQSLDDSNPLLMNKRYPYVSKKQLGRWSTESGDQFRWRKKTSTLGSP